MVYFTAVDFKRSQLEFLRSELLKCLQLSVSQLERKIRSCDPTLQSMALATKRNLTCRWDGTLTQVGNLSLKVGQDAERLTRTHMTSRQHVSARSDLLLFHHFLHYVKRAVTTLKLPLLFLFSWHAVWAFFLPSSPKWPYLLMTCCCWFTHLPYKCPFFCGRPCSLKQMHFRLDWIGLDRKYRLPSSIKPRDQVLTHIFGKSGQHLCEYVEMIPLRLLNQPENLQWIRLLSSRERCCVRPDAELQLSHFFKKTAFITVKMLFSQQLHVSARPVGADSC